MYTGVPQRIEVLQTFGHGGLGGSPQGRGVIQSAESSVPEKCAPEELKQSATPTRGMWEREGVEVIVGSGQLMSDKVKECNG